eukprot:3941870-Rhodomonas_salina.2
MVSRSRHPLNVNRRCRVRSRQSTPRIQSPPFPRPRGHQPAAEPQRRKHDEEAERDRRARACVGAGGWMGG